MSIYRHPKGRNAMELLSLLVAVSGYSAVAYVSWVAAIGLFLVHFSINIDRSLALTKED